tara:strand:- start:93 stop:206 length:114 start_codon:yes stop_codon:yes gene_type:complete
VGGLGKRVERGALKSLKRLARFERRLFPSEECGLSAF